MKRLAATFCALGALILVPSAALAQAVTGAVTGKITYASNGAVTIQSGGRSLGRVSAMIETANRLSRHIWPYVYGGGHAQAGVASIGMPGNGYNGRRRGFDCSGSVAAVLAGAGLWQPGSGVPGDAGVIAQLRDDHLIARGPGRAPDSVNLYDDWGYHIFMSIDGRFFGTSDGGGGNAKGGPTWLYDGASDTYSHAYRAYHVLPSVLRDRISYGQSFSFETYAHPSLMAGAVVGEKVRVSYRETKSGAMNATAVKYVGTSNTAGTVTATARDWNWVTIRTAAGHSLTLFTAGDPDLLQGVQVGDSVQTTYSQANRAKLIVHAVKDLGTPSQPPTNPTQPPSATQPPGQPTSPPGS